jgi:hypothetical protein
MNWKRYREFQGDWQREVILAFDPGDRLDPFLQFRSEQYRRLGKVVRLLTLRPQPLQPSDRERKLSA